MNKRKQSGDWRNRTLLLMLTLILGVLTAFGIMCIPSPSSPKTLTANAATSATVVKLVAGVGAVEVNAPVYDGSAENMIGGGVYNYDPYILVASLEESGTVGFQYGEGNGRNFFEAIRSNYMEATAELEYARDVYGKSVSSSVAPTVTVSKGYLNFKNLKQDGNYYCFMVGVKVRVNLATTMIHQLRFTLCSVARDLSMPIAETTNVPYDGDEKTWTSQSYIASCASGDLTATNAGTYQVEYGVETVPLANATSYNLSQGIALTPEGEWSKKTPYTWTITKATYDMKSVKWNVPSLTYNGSVQTGATLTNLPSGVTVKSYTSNTATNAGTYNAGVASFNYDTNNYEAPTIGKQQWEIKKAKYNTSSVTWGNLTLDYTGGAQSVSMQNSTIYGVGSTSLTVKSITGATQTDAGTYTATAVYDWNKTNYEEPVVTTQFVIRPVNRTLQVGNQSATYTGNEPTLASLGGTNYYFTGGQGFLGNDGWGSAGGVTVTLSKYKGVNASTYTIGAVCSSKNYNVTVKNGLFTITPKSIATGTTVDGIPSGLVYNGTAQTFSSSISNTATITANDYTIQWENNINAGVNTASLVLLGKNNFTGTYKVPFTIKPRYITNAIVAVANGGKLVYSGSAQTPALTVSGTQDVPLTTNDYTFVRWENNVNAGQMKAVFSGKGNYTGEYAFPLTIEQKDIANDTSITNIPTNLVYNGQAQTFAPSVKNSATITTNDYTVSWADNTKAGNAAQIKLTGKGNFKGTKSFNFTIKQKEIEIKWTNTSFIYDGNSHIAQYTHSGILEQDKSAVTFNMSRSGTNVGTYSSTVGFASTNGCYTLKNATTNWNITARRILVKPVDGISLEYGEQLDSTNAAYWTFVQTGSYLLPIENDKASFGISIHKDGSNAVGSGYRVYLQKTYTGANYSITFSDNTMQITRRTVNIAINPVSSQYGDEDAPITCKLASNSKPLAYNDELSDLNIEFGRQAGTAVKEYIIYTAFTNNNYTVIFDSVKYQVLPREITVDIDDVTKQYGDQIITLSSWKLADGSTMAYKESTDTLNVKLQKQGGASGIAVAEYDITGTFSNKNYNVTFNKGIYKITPKKIGITIQDRQSVFGESLADLTDQPKTWILGWGSTYAWGDTAADLKVVVEFVNAAPVDVGEYELVGKWNNANYEITFTKGVYRITPATFDTAVKSYYGIYDGQSHGVMPVTSGLTNPSVQYSLDGEIWQNEPIVYTDVTEEKLVYVKIIQPNYFDYKASATVTIVPKEVAVVWDFSGYTSTQNFTWIYSNTSICPKATVDSGIQGIDLQLNVAGAQTNASDNPYYATASLATANPNFILTNDKHEFYIERATIRVAINSVDTATTIFTSGTLPQLSLSTNYALLGTVSWDDHVLSADRDTYTWTFYPTDRTNYNTESGEVTFDNIREVTVERMEVDASGAIKSYSYGDQMSREGIVVTLHYTDDTTRQVTGFTFEYDNGRDNFFHAGEGYVTLVVKVSESNSLREEIKGITVNKKVVAVPELDELVYSGGALDPIFINAEYDRYARSNTSKVDAGTYDGSLILNDPNNYKWPNTDGANYNFEWTIKQLTLVINPQVDTKKTIYTDDEALPELKLTSQQSSIGTIKWDTNLISATTRTYTWTFTPNEVNSNNYAVSTGSVTFEDIRVRNITKIAVTKIPDKMTYDAFETLDLSGITLTVYFDGGKKVEYSSGFTVRYSSGSCLYAGDIQVTIVYNGGTGDHTTILGGLTVNKIKVATPILSDDEKTFEYDNTAKSLSINGDALYEISGDSGVVDAGKYATTLTLNDAENYEWNFAADEEDTGAVYNINWEITKKSVRVIINNSETTYGEEFPTFTWKLDEDYSLATGDSDDALKITLTKAIGTIVGKYAISGTTGDGNYSVEFKEGIHTIKAKTINIKVDDVTAFYGDLDSALTWSFDYGDTLAYGENNEVLGASLARDPGRAVGEYVIRLSYNNPNYNVKFTAGAYTIEPRPITITISNQQSVYGETIKDLNAGTNWQLQEGSTLAYEDQLNSLAISLSKAPGLTVNDYKITGNWSNESYAVNFVEGTYTITPKEITVSINPHTSVYGQPFADLNTPNSWRYLGSLAYGESRDDLGVTLSKVEGDNVGKYNILYEYTNKNYNISFIGDNEAYEITKANRSANVLPYSGVFDGAAHTVVVETKEGDTVWYSSSHNGTYSLDPITYTNVTAGETVYIKITNDNYNDYLANNTVTITQKQITLVWMGSNGSLDNFAFTYTGYDAFCPTATVDSGIDGITLEVVVTGGQINASETPYIATASINNDNFVLTNPTREFYINGKALSQTIKPSTDTNSPLYAYGTLPELRLSGEEKLVGEIAWDTYTILPGVYNYTWTFTPRDANYAKQYGAFTFKTIVERYVVEMTLDSANVKKEYTAFDTFNPEGLIVTVKFSDSTSQTIDYKTGSFRYESGSFFLAAHTKITFVYVAQTIQGQQEFTAEINEINVSKLAITLPTASGSLTYTGDKQRPLIATSEYYSISNNEAVNAGSYNAVLTLNDTDNTMWAGTNDTADKQVSWNIAKATPKIEPNCDVVTQIWTSGTLPELELSPAELELGTIAWDKYKLSADNRTYSWTFTPNNTDNYNFATGKVTFNQILTDNLTSIEITSDPIDKTYTAFENLSVEGLVVVAHFTSGAERNITNEITFVYDNGSNSFRVGENKVTISFESEGVTKTAQVSGITVNPVRVTIPSITDGVSFVYNGSVQTATSVSASEYELLGDLSATNVGNYSFRIVLKDKVNYAWITNTTEDIVINWSIEKATLNTDSISFKDKTVVYDGQAHSIEVSGLPTGVTVSYIGNEKTESGEYTVTVKFEVGNNYNAIADMTAKLTISKATIDMSGAKFEDKTVVFDGKAHSIEVSGLPAGVTVTYVGNGKTESGEYVVTAKFEVGNNYNAIADMTAKLTIKMKEVISNDEDVKIESDEGINPDVKLNVEDVTEETGNLNLGEGKKVAQGFDITLKLNGQSVQPDGSITIRLLIKEEYRSQDNLKVYYVSNGAMIDMNANRDGNFMEFEVDHLSTFVIVADADTDTTVAPTVDNNLGLIIGLVVGGIAVVAIVIAVILIAKKKKRQA